MIKSLHLFFLLLPAALFAQTRQFVLPLWPQGAPGFERLRDIPEQSKDYWVKHINNPSLSVFLPPPGKANGSAVVICPGGGHRLLVFNAEGIEPARFLSDLGIAVFVLKYRLARDTGSPYKLSDAGKDGQRAIRLVRTRATEWGIDPKRIGMMGFSAGGEVVDMVAFPTDQAGPRGDDAVDATSARPDFLVQIYPGPLFVPQTVAADAPPLFLLAANDDRCCSPPVVELLEVYRKAGASVEAHLLQRGDHGFNMGNGSKYKAVNTWPQRLSDWLQDNNFFRPDAQRPRVEH